MLEISNPNAFSAKESLVTGFSVRSCHTGAEVAPVLTVAAGNIIE